MTNRRVALTSRSVVAVALILFPAVASGQVATLAELTNHVRKGDIVEVRGDGQQIRGAFEGVSPAGVIVRLRGRESVVPAARVQRVRHIDRVTNGALIGLGVGMTSGFVVALRMSADPVRCGSLPRGVANQLEGCGDDRNSAFAILTIAGALTGWAIDGLKNKTLYEVGPNTPRVSVAPYLGARQQSLAVRLVF